MPRCRNVGCIHYSSRLVRGRSHRSSNRCRNSSSSLSSYQAAASSAWGLLTAGGAGAWAGAFFLSERGACITGLTLSQLRAAAAAEAAAGAEIVFSEQGDNWNGEILWCVKTDREIRAGYTTSHVFMIKTGNLWEPYGSSSENNWLSKGCSNW